MTPTACSPKVCSTAHRRRATSSPAIWKTMSRAAQQILSCTEGEQLRAVGLDESYRERMNRIVLLGAAAARPGQGELALSKDDRWGEWRARRRGCGTSGSRCSC